MKYDFDKIIDRRNTNSVKYEPALFGYPEDVLPMWVADMDFAAPSCVLEALEKRVRHGVFGYSDPGADYFTVLRDWYRTRFNWETDASWLVTVPGVVSAVYVAINALTEPGDGVLIQPPVYYPFKNAIHHTERNLITNELVYDNGRYHIDFDDFESQIIRNRVKLFILCSPHNPVGRVWTRDELEKLGHICLKHGVRVVSDEIHQDFLYEGNRHTVFTAIDPAFNDITVTCTAPSKTFNLAGLQLANIFIPNPELRERYKQAFTRGGLNRPGIMGIASCQAAYAGGGEWLDALLEYLTGNLSYLRTFINERLPGIKLVEPEGTYLAWLDCRVLNIPNLDEWITQKARLWLDGGTMFGQAGEGFQRVNFACPRATLREAMNRLESALKA